MDDIECLEKKLFKLRNDIDILKKSMSLVHYDQRESTGNDNTELNNNSLEIKQLEKQVGELQVHLKRQQMNDLKLMEEAMHQKCKTPLALKANSTKDLLEKMECRVMDLSLKAQTQLHHLKHLERTFNEESKQLKKMTEMCHQDDVSTENDYAQKIRHLENMHKKAVKNVEDCEKDNNKLKSMFKNVQKKNLSYLNFLEELKKQQIKVSENEDKDFKEERKDYVDGEQEEKLKGLEKINSDISAIKDTLCCQDIHNIDSAFLEQKATHNNLTEMAKKAERRLIELQEEKRNLASKRSLMKEVDSVYPKSDENIFLAKNRLQEQEKRLETAKEELDRINSHTSKTKDVFQKLILKMNPKVNKTEMNKKDVKQLSKQLENVVRYTFPSTESKCAAKSMK